MSPKVGREIRIKAYVGKHSPLVRPLLSLEMSFVIFDDMSRPAPWSGEEEEAVMVDY